MLDTCLKHFLGRLRDDKLFGAFEAKPEADDEPPPNGSGPMNQHPVYNQNQNYQYTA